ncbi:hypothetical protein HY469_01850 [Candidatus Roizmanbacteria bacterium]|nr:hypothetical protein [Candidatus Roizmanbacteria bacterium]
MATGEYLTSEQLIEATKTDVSHNLLGMPFFPHVEHIRTLLTTHTHLLDDSAYDTERNVDLPSYLTEAAQEAVQREPQSKAFYTEVSSNGVPEIFFRQSFVSTEGRREPDFILRIMLEELAHGYHAASKERPFLDIRDGSFSLLPMVDKKQFLEKMHLLRARFLGVTDPIDPQSVRARTAGFGTVYSEIRKDGESLMYPVSSVQKALEESRALIVQSIFAATVYGKKAQPHSGLQDQLLRGLYIVSHDTSSSYSGQLYGASFLLGYTKPATIEHDFRRLLEMLYSNHPDEFVDYLERTRRHSSLSDFIKMAGAFNDAL